MSTQFELGTQRNRGLPLPQAPLSAMMLASARQNKALMDTLATADSMAMFSLLQSDWTILLGIHQEFAEQVEAADPYVCSFDTLAGLIALAPTSPIRQVLRETAYCREQMAIALGLAAPSASDRAHLVLAGANTEWEILLSGYPEFSAWLNLTDRFTCNRSTLAEGMLFAPTETFRHVLRETFCFREVAAMISDHEHL